MIDIDATFEAVHRLQKQAEELKRIANSINEVLRQDLPDLERSIANKLLEKVRATQNNKIDVLCTNYEPLTIKLRPSAKVGSCFMIALPIYKFVPIMKKGWISQMKYYTKDRAKNMLETYPITIPEDNITKSLLFAAVVPKKFEAAPEKNEPYVTLATIPQRALRLLKGHDTKFPFDRLLVSDDNVPADVAVFG
jgi:hypothetical protein